jgi:hypothetical protein
MTETDAEPGADADGAEDDAGDPDAAETVTEGEITARYYETEGERVLTFDADGRRAAVAQNREGYAMLKVRPTADGDELERYYGFDMALDHVAELLAVSPHDLPVPDAAADMGM